MDQTTNATRPDAVPDEAVWKETEQEWELGTTVDGKRVGEWKWWVAEGYLICRSDYDDSGQLRSFERYHPNGELAQRGRLDETGSYVERVWIRSTEPTPESFKRERWAPEAAWKTSQDFDALMQRFEYFDRDGDALPRIDPKFFLSPASGSETELRRRLSREAWEAHGAVPEVLYGYLYHRLDFCRWRTPRDDREFDKEQLHEVIRAALDSVDDVDDVALQRALTRLANLASATFDLEEADGIERAVASLDAYAALADAPRADYESSTWDECYRAGRARIRAWEAVQDGASGDPDDAFAFVAEHIRPEDLEWAMDPLVMLPEFQQWARTEISERAVTSPPEEYLGFRPDMYVRWNVTRPPEEMKSVDMGRLLASQLAGMDEASVARGLASKEGVSELLKQLIDSGVDPNHFEKGQALLHLAARGGEAATVRLLLEAGADPSVETSGGDKPLDLARRKEVKVLLSEAMAES